MILGFTGTRNGLSNAQIGWLVDVFSKNKFEALHHGACVGADAWIHQHALENNVPVIVHPPTNQRLLDTKSLVPHRLVTVRAPEPYLVRNRAIVAACDGLVAMPSEPETQTGGTWFTVHRAEFVLKPVIIVHRDGQVERRQGANFTEGQQN